MTVNPDQRKPRTRVDGIWLTFLAKAERTAFCGAPRGSLGGRCAKAGTYRVEHGDKPVLCLEHATRHAHTVAKQ